MRLLEEMKIEELEERYEFGDRCTANGNDVSVSK